MSRKRKADQYASSVAQDRNLLVAAPLKSARTAFAARQNQATTEDGARDSNKIADADLSDSSSDDEFLENGDGLQIQTAGLKSAPPFLTEAQFPRTWRRSRELIVDEILKEGKFSARILIMGSSKSGKKSYAQYLVDTLLSPPQELGRQPAKQVAVLHLDPSSASHGLVGHVSLQILETLSADSPADTSLTTTYERHIPVGVFGAKEDSKHFLAAATELLHSFQRLSKSMPMIVCCPSIERESERGLDTRTLQTLIDQVHADHICFLHPGTQYTTDLMHVVSQRQRSDATLWELETLLDPRTLPAANNVARRQQAIQQYFQVAIPSTTRLPISKQRPYALSYDLEAESDFAGCLIFGDVPPNHNHMLSRILNGSVVAVTICDHLDENQFTPGQGDVVPYLAASDPSILLGSKSLGLGLIRSIDQAQRRIFIITPEKIARQLEYVPPNNIILVHGITESPSWAYQDDYLVGLDPCYLGKARKGMQTVKSRRFKKRG